MGRNQRDINSRQSPNGTAAWTTSNVMLDRDFDANGAIAAVGDSLGSLIDDLIGMGVLSRA